MIPRKYHTPLVLKLPGLSAKKIIIKVEKRNKLVKPTHPQTNCTASGPFNVWNVIIAKDVVDISASIPMVRNIITMNEAKFGRYGSKRDSIELDTKLTVIVNDIRNRGEKASLRALNLKKTRNKPTRYTQ
jgi:hypothetical protein